MVSLNLCTDEMLLTLADRDQIASLSFLIKDPSISFMTEQAQELPVNDGRAETILFSGPDLVLSGTYGQQGQAALLKAQGLKVLTLGPWTSLKEGQEQIRTMARALGHPERGEALISRIDAALQRTKDIVQGEPSVLVYDRGSWVSSTDSPMNELLIHMGFKPHQQALGLPHGGMARLETIVTTPPDFLLLDDDSDKAVDNGTALFVHPALVHAVPLERRLVVPRKLTICGGPSTPAAIDALAAEIRAKVR
ncbi:ABC transporter substrate-binding protein [Microvirga sp. G4-2]|uniref:ABC transporter substrate-binding protein n=1 Tax=Microvirga sp. G4-2 TaxID=3434467 RepID=UPI0040440EE5